MSGPRKVNVTSGCFRGEGVEGEREQRIYTPIEVWRRLDTLWPQGVALDPCSGPDSLGAPADHCYPEHEDEARRDGLAVEWPARTYANPPYADLKAWLAHARQQPGEIVMLVPVRIRRPWFRDALRDTAAHVAITRLAFAGHASAFPSDLMLLYFGDRPRCFCDAFGDLGGAFLGPMNYAQPKQKELF